MSIVVKKPKVIVLETDHMTATYDSRDAYNPISISGKTERPEQIVALAQLLKRELISAGISLRNKNQMDLLKWRPSKKRKK